MMVSLTLLTVVVGLLCYEHSWSTLKISSTSFVLHLLYHLTALISFLVSSAVLYHTPLVPPPLIASIGFLLLTTHLMVAPSTSVIQSLVFSVVAGGVLFPTTLTLVAQGGVLANIGFRDVAGGGIVHLFAGLVASICYFNQPAQSYSVTSGKKLWRFVGAGLFSLGWVAYIGTISASYVTDSHQWVGGLISLLVSSTVGAVVAAALSVRWNHDYHEMIRALVIGGFAGIVVASTDPFVLNPIKATALGSIAGVLSIIAYELFRSRHVKSIIAAHVVPGAIGLIALPFVHTSADVHTQVLGGSILTSIAVLLGVVVSRVPLHVHSQ